LNAFLYRNFQSTKPDIYGTPINIKDFFFNPDKPRLKINYRFLTSFAKSDIWLVLQLYSITIAIKLLAVLRNYIAIYYDFVINLHPNSSLFSNLPT